MDPAYEYIKDKFLHAQAPDGLTPTSFTFNNLNFRSAPIVKQQLTWRERFEALNRWQWTEFSSGVRYSVGR